MCVCVCEIIGFQLGKGRLALKQTSKAIYVGENTNLIIDKLNKLKEKLRNTLKKD